jgi:hydrogenase maturation protease
VQATKPNKKVLAIGLGSEYRHDDAVGLIIARRLKDAAPDLVRVVDERGTVATLMDEWRNAGIVMLFDAVTSGGDPGTIYYFDASKEPVPPRFYKHAAHIRSLVDTIELARALDRLPQRLYICGIEGANFEAGEGLSPRVETAAQKVVTSVLAEVQLEDGGTKPAANGTSKRAHQAANGAGSPHAGVSGNQKRPRDRMKFARPHISKLAHT